MTIETLNRIIDAGLSEMARAIWQYHEFFEDMLVENWKDKNHFAEWLTDEVGEVIQQRVTEGRLRSPADLAQVVAQEVDCRFANDGTWTEDTTDAVDELSVSLFDALTVYRGETC